MDMLPGKHFSITDPKGVNTVIYQINKTKKTLLLKEILSRRKKHLKFCEDT